jgi:hypothetical protein
MPPSSGEECMNLPLKTKPILVTTSTNRMWNIWRWLNSKLKASLSGALSTRKQNKKCKMWQK